MAAQPIKFSIKQCSPTPVLKDHQQVIPGNLAEMEQQNVLVRLVNLPLVSSTCDLVSSAYVTTKDNHPYLKSVCEVAESSVRSITSVAMSNAEPLLQRLEPQIALANNMACVGLDKMEEKLPILNQPSGKVVANASEAVVGAKDAVIQRITGVVDKTKEAVQDGVERTKAVVNGSFSTVLGSDVVELMSNSVDAALSKSESLLEQYLPPTDEELAEEATKPEGFELTQDKASYYVRLGSLSTKARKRAYQQAVTRIKDAKCRSQEAIAQLQITVDLVEYARKNMDGAGQKIQTAQEMYNKWLEWSKSTGQDASGDPEGTEDMESHTLAIARNLSHQLQTTCVSLVTSVQGLPQTLQKRAQDVSAMAADVYQTFHAASSFREMSAGLLTTTKEQLTNMKGSLEEVLDLLVNNSPLNWLVGGFNPQLADSQEGEQESVGEDSANQEL
ncbi:perilipin-2-like [Eleutherodactylus coqui]|uniref:perilipin-2-like n=1 Tax=Eleutherodactylus coqui TaxID=57060 RepID=UPI003461F47D